MGCRIIYLCREPKDAFISRWHFDNKIAQGAKINIDTTFTMFLEGCSPFDLSGITTSNTGKKACKGLEMIC
uniref:Sulfotransferase n=1 Tax=Oryza barthii TaxID=65489 RepID=A0A0D3H485_9ORYZ